MSKLQAALAWAARGFPVFPLLPNSKKPAHSTSWHEVASTNPDTVREMWIDPVLRTEMDYNIGMDCTGRVVYDVDVKDGKDGYNNYVSMGGSWDSLVVRTPSRGYHVYFDGPDSANVDLISGVNVRSHHGFVVAPGSIIDGVAYEVIHDVALSWVPLPLEKHLRPPYERLNETVAIDSEASVVAGIRYLESTDVAIEGANGDNTTFVTAARLVREFALSVDSAYAIMRDHWNDRCVPPWPLDELRSKIENAAQYGSAELGRLDPSIVFAGLSIEPPPSMFQQAETVRFGNAFAPEAMPPRPWMIDRVLMLRETTMVVAPGSAGKSSLGLAIVAHLAMGVDFGPYKTHTKCKSIVYNGEDDITEMSRRLYAVCVSYGFPYSEVQENVMLLSAEDLELKLVGLAGRVPIVNEVAVRQLIETASNPEVGLFVMDPLVDVHEVDEGDNPQMNVVMRTIKRIVRESNVAGLIMHHTTKGGTSRQEDRVGNMDIGRGASGIVYKVRIAFTLLNASAQDAETYGLQDRERILYVRLDDAKFNLALASDQATWFRREGVRIPSGDTVGVLKYVKLTKDANLIRLRIAETLIDIMQGIGSGSLQLLQAVALLKESEPLWANKTDADIKKRVEAMFATAIEVRGLTIRLKRDTEGRAPLLLME